MPSPEHKGENLSEQTSTADAVKTNGQPPVDDASLESSLIEADKQTMEEERRKNIDNVDHLKNNGAENLVESSKENINVVRAILSQFCFWCECKNGASFPRHLKSIITRKTVI